MIPFSRSSYTLANSHNEEIQAYFDGSFVGLYRLFALDTADTPVKMQRLLGSDQSGTLYIGASKIVPDRLGSLRKSVSAAYRKIDATTYSHLEYEDAGPHQAGKKILRIGIKFVERFPFSSLRIMIARCSVSELGALSAENDHFQLEEQLLREYTLEFGDRPPLNER